MSTYRHGLIIDKFYPPHVGHHAAIRLAARQCEAVTVLSMASAQETISLAERISWLRSEHRGDANVRIAGIRCDAPLDLSDDTVWTAQVAAMRAGLRTAGPHCDVDAVFCGDDYGEELARRFGATAVKVSRSASNSTAVRRDLGAHWHELAPSTRAGLVTRVVVVGAESTGTTTIAENLRSHYAARGAVWAATRCVPEYGREYTAMTWASQPDRPIRRIIWDTNDFDAVATAVWERRYLGPAARTGQSWTAVPGRAVYLLTDHRGVPWQDDGMREGDLEVRAAMTDWFADELTAGGRSWVLLTGSPSERLRLAIRTVDPLLALRMRFGEPMRGPGFEASP